MKKLFLLLILAVITNSISNAQTASNLASAKTFGLLSGSTITSLDTTVVYGDAGASTSVSSYVKATTIYTGGGTVTTALSNLASAKSFCSGQSGTSISGTLAGQSLTPGVYTITGNATLNGALTLAGDTNAIYIFNITGNLLIDSAIYYGVYNLKPSKIFWNISGTTKLHTYNSIFGIVMSTGTITLNPFTQGVMSLLSQGSITIYNDSATKVKGVLLGARMYSQNEINKSGSLKHLENCLGPQDVCNMIINPSFEELEENPGTGMLNCPQQTFQIHTACDWDSFYWLPVLPYTTNPSLFSDCDDYTYASTCDVGVPWNFYNAAYPGLGQPAHNSGHNYAGIQHSWLSTTDPQDDIPPFDTFITWEDEEKLEKYLPAPLVANKVYYMEFYSTLSDKSNTTEILGVFPATSQFYYGTPIPPLYYTGGPFFTTGTYVTNNINWNKYAGCVSTTRSDIDVLSIKRASGSIGVTPSDPTFYYPWSTYGYHLMSYFYIDDITLRPLAEAGADFTYNCAVSNYIGVNTCLPIVGATYSWVGADAFTLANSAIMDPAVHYTEISCIAAGTYTFQLTVTFGSCSTTDLVVVTVPSTVCSGTTLIGTTTYSVNTTIGPGAPVIVAGNLTITSGATLTITNDNVSFFLNKTIAVTPGCTLIVDDAWLHGCSPCGNMWGGIRVFKGGFLIIRNGSVIEDATTAVMGGLLGTGIPDYQITQTIFNKNTDNIVMHPNSGNMSTNTIKNCIFTCRTLPAPTTGGFITNFNTIKTALTTNTAGSLAPYPVTTTRAGVRSRKGVELIQITNATTPIKVGSGAGGIGDINFFDYLDYGIYLTGTYVEIKNNRFQNMAGAQLFAIPVSPPPYGVGIYAPVQTSVSSNYVYIGTVGATADRNYFYDVFRGIEINDYWMTFVHENVFSCSSTPAIVSGNTIANIAVFTKNIKEKVEVIDNDMTNWITSTYIYRNTIGGGTYNPAVDVNNNVINANASGYCNQGVLFIDLLANTITTVKNMYIRNNNFSDIKNGIKATHIKNNLIIYNNGVNSFTLRYTSSGTVAGIWVEGCDKAEVKNNSLNSLKIPYGSTDNWDLRGIYVKGSTNNKVLCNTLNYFGQCMVFEGNCLSTTNSSYGSTTNGILGNSMDKARTGLMLRLSGVIGTQGSTSFPSSNTWNNTYTFTNGRTNAYSTTGIYNVNVVSKLWCVSPGGGTFPPAATNMYSGTGVAGDQYLVGSGGLNAITSGSAITCPTTYVPPGMMKDDNSLRAMDEAEVAYAEELKALLAGSLSDTVFSSSAWMQKQFIYNELAEHSGLLEDSVLNAFYIVNQTSAYGLFNNINDSIEAGNYAQAAIVNSSVNPANIIEENQKTFNSIYFANYDSLATYTAEDSSVLYAIAAQCAIDGGDAVYQSRNLLMYISNNVIEFTDPCDASIEDSEEDRNMLLQENHYMRLYPNPNNGNMTIECNLTDSEDGKLFIYDLSGKLIFKLLIAKGTKVLNVDAKTLKSANYVYEVIVNNKRVKRDKITIIK